MVGFVSGGALPAARRGTRYDGMLHSSDWLPTFVTGIGGAKITPNSTGPTTLDGHDVWAALLSGGPSPRTEVIHQVENQYFNTSSTGYALRVGDFKVVVGNAGDSRIIAWPELGEKATPFGTDGGVREPGTDHCRAPSGKGEHEKKPCHPHCLFNVVADIDESNDLCPGGNCTDTTHQPILESMLARLAEAGTEGPPTTLAYRFNDTEFKAAAALQCENAKVTNFMEPIDT